MGGFCSECGYKLDQQYKFCPNCGSAVQTKKSLDESVDESVLQGVVICDNCGESNEAANYVCTGCGVKLKGKSNEKRKVKSVKEISGSIQRKKLGKNKSKETYPVKREKELNSKKILLIISIVVIVIVVMLISTGVFDSGLNQSNQQVNQQSKSSGVDLANINAINELENKVRTNPNDKESIIKLANLLQDSGLFERAITFYKKYMELEPRDPNARVDMGICYYNLNDFQSAIKEMETALKFQPEHQIAHLNLGIVNLSAGNVAASKEWFTKAVAINPDSETGKRAQELLQSHN